MRGSGDDLDQAQGFARALDRQLGDLADAPDVVLVVEDVRRISAWVAIIAVPTAIAGIYGMNFEHMPELRWELGYPGVVLGMLLICAALYRYFRRVGWL